MSKTLACATHPAPLVLQVDREISMSRCLSLIPSPLPGQRLRMLLALVTLSLLAPNWLSANEKPFKISGGGLASHLPFPGDLEPAFHFADGTATHLGKYHAEGRFRTIQFIYADETKLTATFESSEPVVFTAANGDELHFNYAGVVDLFFLDETTVRTVFVATFTPTETGSTGRFEKVTGGSFVMTAISDFFELGSRDIPYTWSGEGTLEFGKKKK